MQLIHAFLRGFAPTPAPPDRGASCFPPNINEDNICSFRRRTFQCVEKPLPEGSLFHTPDLAPFVEKLIECQSAKEILSRVLKDGTITVLSINADEAPMGGIWEVTERSIGLLQSESSERKLGHFLFELSNALQYQKQKEFLHDMLNGTVSKEAYAKRWELLEFQTGKDFSAAVQQCIAKHKWEKQTDLDLPSFYKKIPNWETFWNLIKNTNHANQFRSDWEANRWKKIYCEKNPDALDCLS